jgi:AcrR family transcriptional regulator
MTRRPTPRLSSRKQPRQTRSAGLVAAVLEAATQVLAKEGEEGFTTARVAEKAGVSVGSLYQYFPNKTAILYRLQSDEWRQTAALLRTTLTDRVKPPFERLREAVRGFIQSECDEARMRAALDRSAPWHEDEPEARAATDTMKSAFDTFLSEVLPNASHPSLELAQTMLVTTLSELGCRFSERPRSEAEVEEWANAMTEMFWAYLERQARV